MTETLYEEQDFSGWEFSENQLIGITFRRCRFRSADFGSMEL